MKIQVTKIATETFWVDTNKLIWGFTEEDVEEELNTLKTAEDWENYFDNIDPEDIVFEKLSEDYDWSHKCEIIER